MSSIYQFTGDVLLDQFHDEDIADLPTGMTSLLCYLRACAKSLDTFTTP